MNTKCNGEHPSLSRGIFNTERSISVSRIECIVHYGVSYQAQQRSDQKSYANLPCQSHKWVGRFVGCWKLRRRRSSGTLSDRELGAFGGAASALRSKPTTAQLTRSIIRCERRAQPIRSNKRLDERSGGHTMRRAQQHALLVIFTEAVCAPCGLIFGMHD